MKIKKRKKVSRMRGSHTAGRGFKKKARGKGNRGGVGMAGSGKRADHKKSKVLNLFGHNYFGKNKTIRAKPSPRLEPINLRAISDNWVNLIEKGTAKETKKGEYELDMQGYKILGTGEVKVKLKIIASSASKSAIEKVKKAGGDILICR